MSDYETRVDAFEGAYQIVENNAATVIEPEVEAAISGLTKNRGKRFTREDTPGHVALPKYLYRCRQCHYIVFQDVLPKGFTCPNCGQGADNFTRFNLNQNIELFTQN